MIELPKYSVPTYDPHSMVDNERTDFTRRIPSLPEKQLARDSKIAMQLVRAQEQGAEAIIDLFIRKARLLSNPRYWELMRTVWVAAGSTETAPLFRRLMKSPRPCRSWFMTPEDAAALDAMQFPLTVWRAYDVCYIRSDEQIVPTLDGSDPTPSAGTKPAVVLQAGDIVDLPDTDPGISWTLDRQWCIAYARQKRRVIKQRQVMREEIFAYVTRCGESEIIILD